MNAPVHNEKKIMHAIKKTGTHVYDSYGAGDVLHLTCYTSGDPTHFEVMAWWGDEQDNGTGREKVMARRLELKRRRLI